MLEINLLSLKNDLDYSFLKMLNFYLYLKNSFCIFLINYFHQKIKLYQQQITMKFLKFYLFRLSNQIKFLI